MASGINCLNTGTQGTANRAALAFRRGSVWDNVTLAGTGPFWFTSAFDGVERVFR
jgi:hypothetical protein